MTGTAPARARGSVEVAPLRYRVATMYGFRLLLVVALLVLTVLDGRATSAATLIVFAGYLAATGVLSLAAWLPGPVAQRAFTVPLLVDAAFLEYHRMLLDQELPADAMVAVFVAAAILLGSFRTGLKIAMWQSVLMLVALRGQETGLFPPSPRPGRLDGETAMLADLVVLWAVVLIVAIASSTNERELKRRRLDAEALARFADKLHLDGRPEEVAAHLAEYAVTEQGAQAALVVRQVGPRLLLTAGWATRGPVGAAGVLGADQGSALLGLPRRDDGISLALRLDPARDLWLHTLLPGARRLLVIDLMDSPGERTSLVVALGRRGVRTERRVIEAMLQANNTATLAWSRAELLQAAERRAATDGLTGLANRRTFDSELTRLLVEWHRLRSPFALVLVDVDHFKSVNDRYGHQAGDEVLQVVARILAEHAERAGAIAARYGGEEFALLHPGVGAVPAAQVAEEVRLALHDVVEPVRISASFGVAAVPEQAADVDALVHSADAALLAAKAGGRDRVVVGGGHRMPAQAGDDVPPVRSTR